MEALEWNCDYNRFFPERKGFFPINFNNLWNSASRLFTDVKLQKNI